MQPGLPCRLVSIFASNFREFPEENSPNSCNSMQEMLLPPAPLGGAGGFDGVTEFG